MIPSEWAYQTAPAPGRILVQRETVEQKYHGLWRPGGYRDHTRKIYAKVVAIGQGAVTEVELGDWVILAPNVGRAIVFGYSPSTEIELWSIPPEAVIGVLLFDLAEVKVIEDSRYADRADEAALAASTYAARRPGTEEDDRMDEGDSRGLR